MKQWRRDRIVEEHAQAVAMAMAQQKSQELDMEFNNVCAQLQQQKLQFSSPSPWTPLSVFMSSPTSLEPLKKPFPM